MPSLGTSSGPELLISLRRGTGEPLRAQLEDSLRELIRHGALQEGAALPSTRTLAADLGVSRRLVLESYEQLIAEGYLTAEPRRQTRVAPIGQSTPAPQPELRRLQGPLLDLRPRTSDLSLFPRRQWAKALARVLGEAPDTLLGYPDPQGALALRVALAGYLRRVRGVVADPARILICAGFTQALALITRVLQEDGRARIGIEEPGLLGQAQIISAAAGEHRSIPVDEEGLVVAELYRGGGVDAVVCTPAHQFPTGVALSPERRSQLLQWAGQEGLVIEDDYDAEFRYDRAAIGALQGLAPERVLYVGSASKTLAPALRLGWIVAPVELIEKLTEAKRLQDNGAPTLDQLVLAELIQNGIYDRHLRLLRRLLKRRRDALIDELERVIPSLQITGAPAGLHLMATLPSNISMPRLLANATQLRLGLAPISRYSLRKPTNPGQLVIGYGNLSDAAIPTVVALLAQAIG